ncbi:hypothetical protein RRF57_009176 [Xylaria bambusicola]|uniref:Uncharacterized protein n=1 Tax=Xylaria bambusicola TaxID=326684 RepID=A0AAN7UQI4_9PEZI
MAESMAPSPELQLLLADLRQFEIPADAIKKFEIELTKDGIPRDQIDVSTITWLSPQNALVRKVTERAAKESVNYYACNPFILLINQEIENLIVSREE